MAERLDLMETFKQGGVIKICPLGGDGPEPWIYLGDVARRDPVPYHPADDHVFAEDHAALSQVPCPAG